MMSFTVAPPFYVAPCGLPRVFFVFLFCVFRTPHIVIAPSATAMGDARENTGWGIYTTIHFE